MPSFIRLPLFPPQHWVAYAIFAVFGTFVGLVFVANVAIQLGWEGPKRLWMRYEYNRLATSDVLDDY